MGSIDRAKLGDLIFHNEEKRLLLNSIVHPAVRKRMRELNGKGLSRWSENGFYGYSVVIRKQAHIYG